MSRTRRTPWKTAGGACGGPSGHERGCGQQVTIASSLCFAPGELTNHVQSGKQLGAATAAKSLSIIGGVAGAVCCRVSSSSKDCCTAGIPTGCTQNPRMIRGTPPLSPALPTLYGVRLSAKLQRPQQLRQTLHCLEGSASSSYNHPTSLSHLSSASHRHRTGRRASEPGSCFLSGPWIIPADRYQRFIQVRTDSHWLGRHRCELPSPS